MRVELFCEIFIHTKELHILVSLHYNMELYIGIDVKIVHITISNDTKGTNPYTILCSTCINMKYKNARNWTTKTSYKTVRISCN